MEIEEKVKKEGNTSFMQNVLMLMIAQFVIKLMGFIYRFVIINVEGFGDIGNGYYNVGYQVYALLLTFSSVGIPTVISKLVSEKVAIGDYKGAQKIFRTSLKLFTCVGVLFSAVLFFGANIISTKILNVPDVKYTLMVLAPAIMFVSASAVMRGYFSGLGSMKATSITQTLEQFFNCVLTITFVYALVGKDTAIMAAGGNLSTTLAIIIAFIYLVMYYLRRRKGFISIANSQTVPMESKTRKELLKTILAISIPMTLGSLISVVNSTIDTITVSNCIQTAYKGILLTKEALEIKAMELAGVVSKIETIIHLPLALNIAFCTALVPAISSAIAKKEMETAEKRLSFSFFATVLITMPCAVGLVVIAAPILQMIYPAASSGAGILQLTTVTMILVALSYVINGGLYGLGKIYVPVIALIIGGAVKAILNVILISNPAINIYGSPISSIVCQLISFVICTIALNKHIKLQINLKKHILKPIIASLIMGVIVYFGHRILMIWFGNTVSTIVSIVAGIIVYGFMLILTKTLSRGDFYMIPYGSKIYKLLVKMKMYKEN